METLELSESRKERYRRRKRQAIDCCRRMVAFVFSHVGLASSVVAYSIVGGFIFQALEAPYEEVLKYEVLKRRNRSVDELWELVSTFTEFNSSDRARFDVRLLALQKDIAESVKQNDWDGKEEGSPLQWSFPGALLYAVTVITTIGYGHVAPKTRLGRVLTIFYAIVGIPLTFLYLSNIGNFLADCFRLFYKNICCDVCCCESCERQRRRRRLILRWQQRTMSKTTAARLDRRKGHQQPCTQAAKKSLSPNYQVDPISKELTEVTGLVQTRSGSVDESDAKCHWKQNGPPLLSDVPAAPLTSNSDSCPPMKAIEQFEFGEEFYNLRETDILSINSFYDSIDDGEIVLSGACKDTVNGASERASNGAGNETSKEAGSGICGQGDESTTARRTETGLFDREESINWPHASFYNFENLAFVRETDLTTVDDPDEDKQKLEESSVRPAANQHSNLLECAVAATQRELRTKAPIETFLKSNSNSSKSEAIEVCICSQSAMYNELPNGQAASTIERKTHPVIEDQQVTVDVIKRKRSLSFVVEPKFHPARRLMSKRAVSFNENIDNNSGNKHKKTIQVLADLLLSISRYSSKTKETVTDTRVVDVEENVTDVRHDNEDNRKTNPHASFLRPKGTAHNTQKSNCSSSPISNHGKVNISEITYESNAPDKSELQLQKSIEGAFSNISNASLNQMLDDLAMKQRDIAELHEARPGKVRVPISLCLVILFTYIFAGSILFTNWEGWDYLTGSYFCFITLTTIGFGDIVPGTDASKWDSHEKLVLCALYLAFGLSLLAMCFNLMQEEVKEKCKWVGLKLGLIKHNDGVNAT